MFVSYEWLQDYVDISDIRPEKLAELITKSGIEVESVQVRHHGMTNVIVGQVVDLYQHPNADKLKVCQVDIGKDEYVQIICGASNVAKNQKVVVALPGARLPNGMKIKKTKLRGEESNGMICSLQELGIEGRLVQKEYAEGIFVFSEQVEVGSDALQLLGLNDTILEFDLTPNRSDALSMIGVAYEVAAILGRKVKKPALELKEIDEKAEDFVTVTIDSEDDCPYYAAFIVKDVQIAPSPLWLANRLIAAGIRPINNVVDITNYVLLEYGQPLHAFDYDRIGSQEILVRRAKPNEAIETLDNETRSLQPEFLAITNGKEPIALAGVMGGASSEVQQDTHTILLEAAYFNGSLVRTASKQLGLRSEASTRFEKGVARNRVHEAGVRALHLLQELAGGQVVSGVVEAGERTAPLKEIELATEHVNRLLGTTISTEEISHIFQRLGIQYSVHEDIFTVTIPTRRPDLSIPEDLIEEVARLYGYDQIPTTLPSGETQQGKLTPLQAHRRRVRRYLEGAGLYEATTYSLTTKEKNNLFGEHPRFKPIPLAMPMSEDRSYLRTTMLPSLLEVVQYNLNRAEKNIALYEIGSLYLTEEENITKLPTEDEYLAGAITGMWHEHKWQSESKEVDFYVVKGVLEGLFTTLGVTEKITFIQGEQTGLHPGRTAFIHVNDETIGVVGQLHPEVEKELEIPETYVFELELKKLISEIDATISYEKLPRFPSVTRDIALVVDEKVSAVELQESIIRAGGKLLKEVTVFDVYTGEHLEKGKKSIAFSLRYVNPEQTLREEEVNAIHTKILDELRATFSAQLRE